MPAICDQAFLDTIRCAAYPFGVRRSSAEEGIAAMRKACENLFLASGTTPETKATAGAFFEWINQAEREGNRYEIIPEVFRGAK